MSTWLQDILTRRNIVLFQIFLVSCIAHIVVVALVALGSRSSPIQFCMYKNLATNIPVVFDPMLKKGSLQNGLAQKQAQAIKKDLVQQHRAQPSKKLSSKKDLPEKKTITKNTMKSSLMKPSTAKKQPERLMQHTKEAKKVTQKKAIIPKKQPIEKKKEEPMQPAVQEQKIVEPVEENIILDPAVENAIQQALTLQLQQDQLTLGREDIEMFKAYVDIQEQINEQWTPPSGFGELSTDIKVRLDASGTITHMTIEKSSGVLAFDVSTKMVCKQITWPAICYNKETIITFRQ